MELRLLRQGNIIGKSAALKRALDVVERAATVDLPVLICGETGTGKELVAEEIHNRSARRTKPFVAVNTGMLAHELVASEMFGHVKGAFTGASENRGGRFVEADGGTLFLDEIASTNEHVQVALLRALETQQIRPVGASSDKSVNVRIVAASNLPLEDAVDRGVFRADLLHRLQVMRVDVPSLRQRRDDIPILVDFFLQFIRKQYHLNIDGVSTEAMSRLMAYPWPGNIRELKNALMHAAVCQESGIIGVGSLPDRFAEQNVEPAPMSEIMAVANSNGHSANGHLGNGHLGGGHLGGGHLGGGHQFDGRLANGAQVGNGFTSATTTQGGVFLPWGMQIDQVVEVYARETLQSVHSNKTEAAKRLGVARKTLYNMLRERPVPVA